MFKKIKNVYYYFIGYVPELSSLSKTGVAKNIKALYVIQIAEYAIPLITIPYVVRIIGPSGFGIAAFCQGLTGYFLLLVDYGFSMSATRSISVNRDDKKKINKIFSSTIVTKLLLFLVGLIALIIIIVVSSKIRVYSTFMFVAYLGILGNAILPLWLFQGLEDMGFLSYADIFAKSLMVIGIFVFLRNANGVFVYLILLSLASILYGSITLIKAFKKFKVSFVKITVHDIRISLKEGWVLFLSNASVSLYSAGNPFILGIFVTPAIVGYYSGAEKITRATLGLITPFSQAVYPKFSKLARDSKELFFTWTKKFLFIMGGLGLFLTLMVFIFAPIAVKIILGPNFGPSVTIIRVLSLLPFLSSVSMVLGSQIMLPLGKDKNFTKIVFIAGLINFTLVAVLASKIGAMASAIALISAESYATLAMLIYVNRQIRKNNE